MSFAFNPTNEAKFQTLLTRYPKADALSLPALWMVQYQEGYISADAMRYVAQRTGLSPAHIYGLATFYTMFKTQAIGTYHIEVCKTLSCDLCGKEQVLQHLEKKLGIKPGETTPDGKFTISVVECMGACGGAPMMSLNEVYHENLTKEKIDTILGDLA